MLKCVFKFSRSDWGLRIHVPNKFSDKTLVQKGKGVVERAFTLELRSPDCNSTSVVPVSENLRDPTPSFPCYTTHSHNTIICLGPTGTDLIMFFILFHVRTPLDSQAAFQLPQLEVWELACLASEPVLSPLPIPSQVRKSVSFVLQDFVNCQQNLQCSFSINWNSLPHVALRKTCVSTEETAFPAVFLVEFILSLIEIENMSSLLLIATLRQVFNPSLFPKTTHFESLSSDYVAHDFSLFLSPKCQGSPSFPLPKLATHSRGHCLDLVAITNHFFSLVLITCIPLSAITSSHFISFSLYSALTILPYHWHC